MAEIYRRLFLASARQFAYLLVCANRKCVTLSFYCIRGLCALGMNGVLSIHQVWLNLKCFLPA